MRTPCGSLFATAALALSLPTLAAAQEDIQADVVPLSGWNHDDLYAGGISVKELMDADVNGPTGEDIGDVENVLFDQSGNVLSIVAEVGGFLEIGDTHVNIPWDQVQVTEGGDEVAIPVTQEAVEDYTLFTDPIVTRGEAVTDIEQVSGDNAGVVGTGPAVWRATEVIGDYARLKDGDGWANYGYVSDLILHDGKIAAVVVGPDVTWGRPGLYAYPYYAAGWHPGSEFYDLPYERAEADALEPFDPDRLAD